MAGLSGVVGDADADNDTDLGAALQVTGDEHVLDFEDGEVRVDAVFHTESDQPSGAGDGDALVWVWGNVTGFEGGGSEDGYDARTASAGGDVGEGNDAAYVATLYDRHGLDAIAGLNGDFAGVVYDRQEGRVSLFVDRLAARELFYTTTAAGAVVFSSLMGSLAEHPAVRAEFDADYLAEYLTYGRVFGVKTPLSGVRYVEPGTVVTVDVDTGRVDETRHWRPRYRPEDRPLEAVVDDFVDGVEAALRAHTRPGVSYGLLLSGGSDSRLLLAAMPADRDVTAYHMADWTNIEARTAERVAEAAGVDLEVLVRDAAYDERLVETTPRLSNFAGDFSQAQAAGFTDRLENEVDVLLSSHMSGILAKAHSVPLRSLRIPGVGDLTLPTTAAVDSVTEYVDWRLEDQPAYLRPGVLERTLRANTTLDDGVVDDHGVEYDSLQSLFVCSKYVPRHSDDLFAPHLMHALPYRDPLVDNRLLDLRHRTPMRYLVRYNVVNRAIDRLDSDLAAIPHGTDRVPPSYQFPLDWAYRTAYGFLQARLPLEERPPEPHMQRGPWPDRAAVIRERNFFIERLLAHRDTIERLPMLEWDGVLSCYRDHLAGADNTKALYTLLTLLEMPVTERVVAGLDDATVE